MPFSGCLRQFFLQQLNKRCHAHAAQVFAFAAYGDLAVFFFLVADDDLVGVAVLAVVADFVADFFVAQIQFGAQSGGLQLGDDVAAVVGLFFGDVHHHHLHGGEPQREGAGVLFDQDADKAFH